MAITATISTTPQGANAGQRLTVTLVVSNSGGSAVTVTDIAPTVTPYGATQQNVPAAIGLPFLGAGANVTVPASGSTTFSWDVALFAPNAYGSSTLNAYYEIGAVITTLSGSTRTVTQPTANAIVGVLSQPQTEHAALLWFNQFESSGLVAVGIA